MGVFKRYRDAQAAQQEAANAVPGAYQSNYTDRIRQTLDALGAGADEAADVGTDSQLYRQYRGNATQNARAAAENAAAGAAALSGGYGSSYANSAAQQGYQQEMANVDNGLAGLREKALSEYQLKKSGLAQLFSGLVNQDSLEAAEHQTAVSHAQDWRDYKLNRASQAASEKESFLKRSAQNVSNVWNALQKAYDLYKGYDFQQKQLDLQKEQWEYNKNRTEKGDAVSGYNDAFGLYGEGATDAAKAVLSLYGLDTSAFDNYSGAPITRADKANALSTAAGLAGNGSDTAARSILELYGLDPSAVDSYSAIAGRQLSTALAKAAASGSSGGSSRKSGSSSGSSGNKSTGGWTNSQLQSMAKSFSGMKETNPLYSFYKQTLTDNGWLKADNAVASNKSSEGSLPVSPQGRMAQKYGTVTNTGWTGVPEKKSGGTTTGTTQSKGVDMAVMLAKNYAKKGYSSWAIINNMSENGYSDDEIARALKEAGVTD